MDTVAILASRSLMRKTNAWYVGANVPGKPRFFVPGKPRFFPGDLARYREICSDAAANGYQVFELGG